MWRTIWRQLVICRKSTICCLIAVGILLTFAIWHVMEVNALGRKLSQLESNYRRDKVLQSCLNEVFYTLDNEWYVQWREWEPTTLPHAKGFRPSRSFSGGCDGVGFLYTNEAVASDDRTIPIVNVLVSIESPDSKVAIRHTGDPLNRKVVNRIVDVFKRHG